MMRRRNLCGGGSWESLQVPDPHNLDGYESKIPTASYFCVCGNDAAYCGINNLSSNRRLLVSLGG